MPNDNSLIKFFLLFIFHRADKEALETNLFDAQTTVANLNAKKDQLEEANQGCNAKNESLQGTSKQKHCITWGDM